MVLCRNDLEDMREGVVRTSLGPWLSHLGGLGSAPLWPEGLLLVSPVSGCPRAVGAASGGLNFHP